MQRILIIPIPMEGPNGDRDTQRHTYFDYEIHLLVGDESPCEETCIHRISGFDSWRSAINDRTSVKAEAQAYGEKLATRLECLLEWDGTDCEVWNVSLTVKILAVDSKQALEIFQQRYQTGAVKPAVWKDRTVGLPR